MESPLSRWIDRYGAPRLILAGWESIPVILVAVLVVNTAIVPGEGASTLPFVLLALAWRAVVVWLVLRHRLALLIALGLDCLLGLFPLLVYTLYAHDLRGLPIPASVWVFFLPLLFAVIALAVAIVGLRGRAPTPR